MWLIYFFHLFKKKIAIYSIMCYNYSTNIVLVDKMRYKMGKIVDITGLERNGMICIDGSKSPYCIVKCKVCGEERTVIKSSFIQHGVACHNKRCNNNSKLKSAYKKIGKILFSAFY